MKNITNIYDIDGELIRSAGDNHKFTIEEAQKRIEIYKEKLKNLDETDKKRTIYQTYIDNLNKYIWSKYAEMSTDKLKEIFENHNTTEDQIKQAIDELKKEIEDEDDKRSEEPIEPESILVDGKDRPETVMDEYVPFTTVE